MGKNEYLVLEKKNLRETFIDYFHALDIPMIDYLAIGVQDTVNQKSTSLMSNAEWQKTFKDHNFAPYDPIRKVALNSKTSVFSFEDVNHQDPMGSEVMRQRKKHQIENGLVLVQRNLGHNFMMTLGTGFKNFQSHRFFLDYQSSVYRIFNDLIQLVSPLCEDFRPIKDLNADAK
jgi:hypothetical protein